MRRVKPPRRPCRPSKPPRRQPQKLSQPPRTDRHLLCRLCQRVRSQLAGMRLSSQNARWRGVPSLNRSDDKATQRIELSRTQ
jgi:hypothetical protein